MASNTSGAPQPVKACGCDSDSARDVQYKKKYTFKRSQCIFANDEVKPRHFPPQEPPMQSHNSLAITMRPEINSESNLAGRKFEFESPTQFQKTPEIVRMNSGAHGKLWYEGTETHPKLICNVFYALRTPWINWRNNGWDTAQLPNILSWLIRKWTRFGTSCTGNQSRSHFNRVSGMGTVFVHELPPDIWHFPEFSSRKGEAGRRGKGGGSMERRQRATG